MPTIVHFEVPADDVERAGKFYGGLFGWTVEKAPGDFDYWFIRTTDAEGEPGVGGGLMARQHPQQPITNYVGVESVDETAAKVQELGGGVLMEKMPVPGMGWFAVCQDTEGNCFGVWQCDANAG